MRFSTIPAVLALVSAVSADFFDAIQTPDQGQILTAGTPFSLVWNPDGVTGTATIQLNEGLTNTTLQPGPIIAQSIDNSLGSFSWTPEDRGHPTYGWQITLDSDTTQIELSHFFHIQAAGGASASGSASSSSGGATTTIKLSTGPSYTSTATSTTTSTSTASTSATFTKIVTSSFSNSTISVPTSTNGDVTTTSIAVVTNAPTTTSTKVAGSSSTTTSAPVSNSSSAASANIVRGGLAVVGGLVLALAL